MAKGGKQDSTSAGLRENRNPRAGAVSGSKQRRLQAVKQARNEKKSEIMAQKRGRFAMPATSATGSGIVNAYVCGSGSHLGR